MPPMMLNPYRPVSPIGSPEFPLEPHASTMAVPRPPPRPPMAPGRATDAAVDFLTERGREGAGQQLLAGGALNAASSVGRDEAREMAPLIQMQKEQQVARLLAAIQAMQSQFAPAGIDQPAPPRQESFAQWGARKYPQLSSRRRRFVPVGTIEALRKEYMTEQAAGAQNYATQMRGYGAQMRGRTPFRPVAAGELLKGYYPPQDVPAVRERELADRAIAEQREDVLLKGERDFKREQTGRPKDLMQGLTWAIEDNDQRKVDSFVQHISKFPADKRLSTKPLQQGLQGAIEEGDQVKVQQYTAALLAIASAGIKKGVPADIKLASETLEYLSRLPFGIPKEAKGAFGTALEKVEQGMRGPSAGILPGPVAPPVPTVPAAGVPPSPGAAPAQPSPAPRPGVDEMLQRFWSLSPEDRRLFSAGLKKGPGGE